MLVYPERIGCLCVEVGCIFPFFRSSAKETETTCRSLSGLVGFLEQCSRIAGHCDGGVGVEGEIEQERRRLVGEGVLDVGDY